MSATVADSGASIQSWIPANGHEAVLQPYPTVISFRVKVVAADGVSTSSYQVSVGRQWSTDTRLRSLTVSSGTLVPAFNAATLSYTLALPNGVTAVTATAVTEHPLASVQRRRADWDSRATGHSTDSM